MERINNVYSRRWNILLVCLTILIMLLSVAATFAQGISPVTVKGKINFSDIKVKAAVVSAHNGRVQSDENGNFSIPISRLPDTLTISAVSYKTEYFALRTGREEIIVDLVSESLDLGPIEINTGYQLLKPNETNGTVAVITKEQLNARGGSNILDRLLGQSSGLLQNAGKSPGNVLNKTGLSVRGLGTFNGPLDPLIVLDGFIYEGNINNINPNDIEQASILKDAAAASIWGARAGNGVIVLTSKKAAFNQKLTIDASASLIIRALPDLSGLPQMSSADYIEVERLMFDKGYYNARITNTPYIALSPVVELLLKKRRGLLGNAETEAGLDALKAIDSRRSYLDEFYTHAQTRQYSLGLKGGNELYSFLLTGSYEDLLGETYSSSKKLNLNLSQEIRINKRLKLSTKAYFTNSNQLSGRPAFNTINVNSRQLPYLAFRDESGNPLAVATNYRGAFTDTLFNSRLLDWKYYPAEEYLHNQTKSTSTEIYANASLNYKILEFLNVSLSYQYQKQQQLSDSYLDESSYTARNMVNLYSQYNRSMGVITYIVPRGGINRWSATDVKSNTLRGQFNLDKTLGHHHINAIAGAETREVLTDGNGMTKYGYSKDPLTFAPIDEVNAYRTSLSGSSQQIGSGTQESATQYRFISSYVNMAYTFMGRYALSGSLRNDGSNIFGASVNDKWKPLWSAGLGWTISEEQFYKLSWLPILKLKGTFGYSGNVDLTKTALSVGIVNTNALTGLPFTRITAINNPGLKWEQLSQFSLGLEFAARGNRLSGSIGFFKKRGKDLYGSSLYDYTTWGGSNELVRNVADMSGKGVELDLHSLNIRAKDFKWNTDGYFNYNDSRTLNYYNPAGQRLFNILASGNTISPLIGKPLYALALYKWAGLDQSGNPMGYLKGIPSTNYQAMAQEAQTTGENLVYIGSASPVFYGSLINTFRYKAISLSVNLSYKLGYYAQRSSFVSSQLIENGKGHSDYARRWQKPGDELLTNIPAFLYPANTERDGFYEASEVNAIKADQIRLDYINLAYSFSYKAGKNIKKVELYAGLQNIGLIWRANKQGLDPDYMGTYSPSRSLLFGLRTGF